MFVAASVNACTVAARIPETGLRVSVKLLRDASWIANAKDVEDMEIPPEMCLELLLAADYLDV